MYDPTEQQRVASESAHRELRIVTQQAGVTYEQLLQELAPDSTSAVFPGGSQVPCGRQSDRNTLTDQSALLPVERHASN